VVVGSRGLRSILCLRICENSAASLLFAAVAPVHSFLLLLFFSDSSFPSVFVLLPSTFTMANPTTSFDRDALRRNLSAALSESIVDVGDIEDAARRAQQQQANNHVVQQQQQNVSSFMTRGPAMQYMPAPSMLHAQSFFNSQHQHQPQQQQYGGSNDLLLAVAQQREQARILEQARAAVILAQERERLLMQQSYQSLLQNHKMSNGSSQAMPKITDALRYSLFSHATQHQAANPLVASQLASHQAMAQSANHSIMPKVTENTTKALEALGSNLRKSTDPYIDVSSLIVQQPSAEAEARQAKRTRGGVT